MDTLRYIHMDDLLRFKWRPEERTNAATGTNNRNNNNNNNDGEDGGEGGPPGGGNWGYRRGYGFRNML